MKEEIKALAKARGLDIAEDAASNLGDLALDIIDLVVSKSENLYDDMVWGAVKGKVKEKMDEAIDKIDGVEG